MGVEKIHSSQFSGRINLSVVSLTDMFEFLNAAEIKSISV